VNLSELRGFIDHAAASFEAAFRAVGGSRERRYAICGKPCSIRPAGHYLDALLTPALSHLECGEEERGRDNPRAQDLTILAWDSVSTGTPFNHPWTGRPRRMSREFLYHRRDGIRILYNSGRETLSFFDATRRIAGYWINSADHLYFSDCASPFWTVFQWWMRETGGWLIHAAAVGREDGRGVLIPGGKGVGKSTVTALCLKHGLQIVGDDYVILTRDPVWRAENLYNSLKLTTDAMTRMPDLADLVRRIGRQSPDKVVLYMDPTRRKDMIPGLEILGILIPRITGRNKTTLLPASAAEAMRSLAPSTLYVQAGEQNAAFKVLADFVRSLPCQIMELGGDLSSTPEALKMFIRRTC
jgi:hypothetical protein